MLRSELIEILQKHLERFGDRDVYVARSVEPGFCRGTNIDAKDVGLDADDHTVIDIVGK